MRLLYALAFSCLLSLSASSQLLVEQTYTIEQYVNEVLIGNGVVATNITYSGSEEQLGYLSGAEGLFSLASGLVLSTDHATHLSDPVCMDTNVCLNCEGAGVDPDLLSVANSVPPLIGQGFTVSSVNDLCILEFDFEAGGDSISFNYVFGSDEYLEWVNSTYNDIFAFFLSGPGITGPYASPAGFPNGAINIAQVPGSDPLLPVTISSVNDVTNPEYYIDNFNNDGICIDGYTQTFTAASGVQCGEVYHIKLAIADGSDTALESFVVLEEGSFSSNSVQIVANAAIEGAEVFLGDTTVVEGCNDAVFTVVRPNDEFADTITLNVFGTATMGADFSNVFTTVILLPGESSIDVSLGVINDNVNEGPEWVTIEYEYVNGCGDTIVSSATIVILDPNPVTLFTEPVGCLDDADGITLAVDPLSGYAPYEYVWDTDISDTLNEFYYNTGGIPGTATVLVTDICGSTAEASVSWEILELFEGEDETICLGQISTVPASGGTIDGDGSSMFSEILTWLYDEDGNQVYDEDGNEVWVNILGANMDTVLVSFFNNLNQITGLYDGLYESGDGGIGEIAIQLIDGCGSIGYSTITVEICELVFPNVFTPDGQGDNELFTIQGLQGYPNSQILVYDRWGTLVFSDDNFIGGWRGVSNTGGPLVDGTYYFKLSVLYNGTDPLAYTGDVITDTSTSGVVVFSGHVMILRKQ